MLRVLFFFIIIISFNSCSKDEIKKSVVKEKSLELQVLEAYNEGKNALEGGDVLFAAKKFNEAETLYPQSDWAPKSALMAAYSLIILKIITQMRSLNLKDLLMYTPHTKI